MERGRRNLKRAALVIAIVASIGCGAYILWARPKAFEQAAVSATIREFKSRFPNTRVFVEQITQPAQELVYSLKDPEQVEEVAEEIDDKFGVKSVGAVRRLAVGLFPRMKIEGTLPSGAEYMEPYQIEEWQDRRFNSDSTAPAGVSFQVSRPILVEQDLAIVAFKFWGGGLYAQGSVCVLKRDKGSWRMADEIVVWVS